MSCCCAKATTPSASTLLGIPAGTLEPGETPEACARRELTEETGYRAGRLTQLASYYTSPGYTDERLTIFHAADCEPAGGEIDPDELIRLTPMPLADVPHLLAPGPDQIEDVENADRAAARPARVPLTPRDYSS